jgi:RsiW-degrading membrane proteinase PrsW (M82 family)
VHQAYQPTAGYAVPAYEQHPRFPEMPASPAEWRYQPPSTPSWWHWWHRHSRTLRAVSLVVLLLLCGLTILLLVRKQTGTEGLLVGLALAVLPVPLLVAALRWLDGVHPARWRNHAFAFAWGACAATLVALIANTLTAEWLSTSVLPNAPHRADTIGAVVVAPLVEESVKAAPVLLLFLFRRQRFHSVVPLLVAAGISATGFAFTENVLYLGSAYGEDSMVAPGQPGQSVTLATFLVRIVFSPFAHPLFTSMTGLGLGVAAMLARRRRVLRVLVPAAGFVTAAALHAIWNGSATAAGGAFLLVYALFMLPVFGLVTWLAIWSRQNQLKWIRATLPAYAATGWISPPEAWALGTMRARTAARTLARRTGGVPAVRTVVEYQHFATALALLRVRAETGVAPPDFAAREQELLHHLWRRRPVAGPPTEAAAFSAVPRRPVPPPQPAYPPSPGPWR